MKIYIAIWKDRHTDTTAYAFSTAEKAVDWARATCKEYDRHGEYAETQLKDCLYDGQYSCDGCGIRVIETELDKED